MSNAQAQQASHLVSLAGVAAGALLVAAVTNNKVDRRALVYLRACAKRQLGPRRAWGMVPVHINSCRVRQ